ncbi:MAG: hypothetical protein JXQ75_16515 [Phycisphaerae bacterium]|nr:hypothetical protein [Phycisphaerae bacterium]
MGTLGRIAYRESPLKLKLDENLAARGKREDSVSEAPFLTVKTTDETPVPQFCHGLLGRRGAEADVHRPATGHPFDDQGDSD